jgi:hypothetical protein
MSQNEKNVGPDLTGVKSVDNNASTPPAQPPKNVPDAINPGAPVTVSPGVQLENAPPAPPPVTVPAAHPGAQGAAASAQAAPPVASAPAAPKPEEAAVVKVNSYVPGGLSKDVVNPVPNPAQTDQNFPFSAGQRIHEVAHYQNFFTFPLDTYYNVFDAIYYFSDEKNRNRYTYEQQQLIISRIVRAALEFGIPIEGITEKLMI